MVDVTASRLYSNSDWTLSAGHAEEGGRAAPTGRSTNRTSLPESSQPSCVDLWSSFRKQHQELGRPQHIFPDQVHFATVSATPPVNVLPDLMSRLGISKKTFMRSPNEAPSRMGQVPTEVVTTFNLLFPASRLPISLLGGFLLMPGKRWPQA